MSVPTHSGFILWCTRGELTAGRARTADAPRILPTFSPRIQGYWVSDARMGKGEWQKTLDADPGECISRRWAEPQGVLAC